MIIDVLKNSAKYIFENKRICAAFEYLHNENFLEKGTGRFDIDGDNLFVLVSDYSTKSRSGCYLEGHRKYIDVQYLVKGNEMIGYAPLKGQKTVKEYNDEKDAAFYGGECSWLSLEAGMFALFFPDDLHMPGISNEPSLVRKIVVKVKI